MLLSWKAPEDPSGIKDYRVELQRRTGMTWTAVTLTNPVTTGTSLNVAAAVSCGDGYRWRVTARDTVDNIGLPSAWAEFGMTLP